ncbi:MAG: UDP-3-O-(3-hydroxymyristoyl)glucosamine N-acyltransferase [Alphaproteobacteria bacterium]|nr:UDP-3-O-(3-hydroxymyristoyl)glucosamine N-acyltransferase [Alphaproteobacteria bacterium]
MVDARFFKKNGPFKLSELAAHGDAKVSADADADFVIRDIGPLDAAGPDCISFLANGRYLESFTNSDAGAAVVAPAFADRAPEGMALLLSEKPYRSFALIAHAFYDEIVPPTAIHPTAVIDASAKIGDECYIGPGVVISRDAVIGDRVQLGPNTVVGPAVSIGSGSRIGANASFEYCDIGEDALIHPGVRIGQRGFGFDMDKEGFTDVPQLGRVIVGAGVEIGANSTLDRGAGPDTVIGDGCKIDNLVQIGHNVQLGKRCVLVAQTGIAGSTRLGDNVVVAGQAGITGHLEIGSGAQIGVQALVIRNVPAGAKLTGSPAMPVREFFRMVAKMRKLSQHSNDGTEL